MSIVETDPHRGAYAPIPGPVDRESFFAAQARNRRATWRLTALSALAVLILGIPLSAVLGPLLYGAAILALDTVNLFTPMPDPVHWAFAEMDEAEARANQVPGHIPGTSDPSPKETVEGALVILAVLVPPGTLALLFVWLGVRALFLRSGVGGVLLSLGAREPRTGDLEEHQLANVVAEMAIAAGVSPPRVMLLDTPAVNAAAVGSSLQDGVIVVSRGLLDALDRDETQGIVGHLIGSVGNGDLRIAMTMLSLFQTVGVMVALLTSPFGRQSRSTLWRLARFAFRRRDPAEAEQVTELLGRALEGDNSQDIDDIDKGRFGKVKSFFMLPFLMAYMAFWLNERLLGMILVGPPLTAAWRTRRYLADATAVQLTRNPDGLARALLKLSGPAAAVPGAGWASYLFAAWPGTSGGQETFASKAGILGALHPATGKRLRRLRAMGSTVQPPAEKPGLAGLPVVAWLFLLPLGLILAFLMTVAAGLSVMVSLAIDMLFFFGILVIPLHALLRHLAR